jgi:hypothetical protein
MVAAYIYGVLYPTKPLYPLLDTLKDGGVWLIGGWLVLGAAMYTNFLTRILVWAGRALTSPFPVRHFLGINRLDQHPAWPALTTFLELNENARPLFVSLDNASAFADWLIRTIREEGKPASNRADSPTQPAGMDVRTFRERIGNALLTGCVIEGAHYHNSGFPRREWGGFYDVIGELATQTDIFSPTTLIARYAHNDYYDELIGQLNDRLVAQSQSAVPDSPALVDALRNNLRMVAEHYAGACASIDPGRDGWLKSRSEQVYARVERLPLSEGMRAQFVKLAIVWNVWEEFAVSELFFAFSKGIATLMLDRGVILATDDVKVLSFDNVEDRVVARAAEKVVIANAITLIETDLPKHQTWLPPQSRDTRADVLHWWITYEVDFRMWDYALRMNRGDKIKDDAGLTRWQLSFGQVTRVKKS